MVNILAGIMIGILSVLILMALAPTMVDMIQPLKGSDTFNCPGYLSTSGTNYSYNSSLSTMTNTMGCGILDLVVPLIIIGVIIAIVLLIMYGGRDEQGAQF